MKKEQADYLPIIIVAPNKKIAARALRNMNLPNNTMQIYILIGNGGVKQLEGLAATRERTFFVDPDGISWSIYRQLHDSFIKYDNSSERV